MKLKDRLALAVQSEETLAPIPLSDIGARASSLCLLGSYHTFACTIVSILAPTKRQIFNGIPALLDLVQTWRAGRPIVLHPKNNDYEKYVLKSSNKHLNKASLENW